MLRPEIAPILGNVQAEYLVGLPLPALQKRLRELGSDSVVLTMRLFPGRRRTYLCAARCCRARCGGVLRTGVYACRDIHGHAAWSAAAC